MLDNPRFNATLSAKNEWQFQNTRQLLLDQQYLTQKALSELGVNSLTIPSKIPKADRILMVPEKVAGLRKPYAVEILGMPGSGKTTMINRYLEELWIEKKRHEVVLVKEGVRSIKEEYGNLRYTDPFMYSLLAGSATFLDYIEASTSNSRMIIADRGQIDRRIFRRILFSQGNVNPKIMEEENQFMYGLENTPVQICGIIMFMVRPETSLGRIKKEGPVVNTNTLPKMYEQYMRLHREILNYEIPYRIYELIDAEKPTDQVYEQFKYVMDSSLNIVAIMLGAIAKTFPDQFDKAKKEYDQKPYGQTHAERVMSKRLGGKRVRIVGGDEMESDEEILYKPVVEGVILKK